MIDGCTLINFQIVKMEVDVLSNIPLLLVFGVVFLLSYLFISRRKNYPPGPRGLPIIGNLMWFANIRKTKQRQCVALCELQKTYGDVICLWQAGQPFVFLHGFNTIHDAFVKNADILSNRPSWLKPLKEATKEGKGVIWQSGNEWKVIRKFVLQTLRDFGVGKTSIEEKIIAEVDAATEYLTETGGRPTDPRLLTSMMIGNVIFGIVFAKRYNYKDEAFHEIIHNLDTLFQSGGLLGGNAFVPGWILKLVNREAYELRERRLRTIRWIKDHIYGEISKHEDTFDSENIRDFIDLYIEAKKKGSDEHIFNEGNMFRVIMDLFIAGSETTSNTINWCLLYMQEYPDVQKKCQQVIQEKCGDRMVTWADRSGLPYIEAVLLEIQRLANIAPFSVPHTNEEDTTIGGYFIPRRSLIQANLYSSNMDLAYWEEPALFKPERFLDNSKIKKNPALIPFSIGPRICLGESLAKMEMFIIFTNLLQRFTFSKEDNSMQHSFGCIPEQTTSAPLPYKTRAIKRS